MNTHVQEDAARLHTSRNTSVSYLENISNAIHLQAHYYGSVIIQNSQNTSSLYTVGNSPSCQLGPLNTVHGEENWHHEKCMRLERERWARVSQSTDAAQRPRISLLCVCVCVLASILRAARIAHAVQSLLIQCLTLCQSRSLTDTFPAVQNCGLGDTWATIHNIQL